MTDPWTILHGDPTGVDRMNARREELRGGRGPDPIGGLAVVRSVGRVPQRKELSVTEVAQLWGVSEARVKVLCAERRIYGAKRGRGRNRPWTIPGWLQPFRTDRGEKPSWWPRVKPGTRGPLAGFVTGREDDKCPI